jgi:hypothetical protein
VAIPKGCPIQIKDLQQLVLNPGELSDVELMLRTLCQHFERDPTADELHEWMTLPSHEAERRNREMLAAVRRQLQNVSNHSEARHA